MKGLLFTLLLLLPLTALAAPSPPVDTLDDMVVTATSPPGRAMESPSNILALTAEDIKATDAKTIADLIKKLPGIFITNASGFKPRLSLRGTRIGMSPGAQVFINGIPMDLGKFDYTDYTAIPVDSIQRIEVIKGPLSSLYGGNSARGVINITTQTGSPSTQGNLSLAGGSFNYRRATARLSGTPNNLEYTLNAKGEKTHSFRDRDELEQALVETSLNHWLADNCRLGAYVNFTDKEKSQAKPLTRAQREEDRTQALDYGVVETQDLISGMDFSLGGGLWDSQGNIYYKHQDREYFNYLETPSKIYREALKENTAGLGYMATLKSPLASRPNKISLGADYDHTRMDIATHEGVGYTTKDPEKSGDFGSQKLGIFIQDEFCIRPTLTLTAGLRYDYFLFKNQTEHDFSDGGTKHLDTEPEFDRLNPRIALNWHPSRNLALYGSFSQSYRSPSIYDFYASNEEMAANNYTLEPETFTQYEAGLRYELSKALHLDAALFHLVIDEMMDSLYDGTTYLGKQNINQATLKGFELSLKGSPMEGVRYTIAYTLTRATYSKDFFLKSGENINGNRLSQTPRHRLNLDLGWDIINQDAGTLAWHLNVSAQSDYQMDNANTKTYPGHGVVGTLLRWTAPKYEIFGTVENLLDKDYDGHAQIGKGKERYYPAAGINFRAGVSLKF